MRKSHTIMLGVLLIFGLCACGKQGQVPIQEPQETDPAHIYEQVRDDILIDADVIRPKENATPKVYVAEQPEFTKENMDSLLAFLDDEIVFIQDEFTENELDYYRVRTKKGGEVIMDVNHDVNNRNCSFSYVIPEFRRCYMIVDGYQRNKSGPASSEEENTELFTVPKEFSFATAEEAEAEIRKALASFGLTNLILENTLYLDHTVLETYETENLVKLQKDYTEWYNRTYIPKDTWTEADDCYEFTFTCGVDGIPMIHSHLETPFSVTYSCSISARCNSHGIVRLTAASPWSIGEEDSTLEHIISAQEAMETVKKKLNSVYLGHDTVVEEIALRYVPVQDKSRWLLTPVWEVLICEKDVYYQWADVTVDERSYVLIDAFTGEEM